MKKIKITQKGVERIAYILVIVALVIYGLHDVKGAETLIRVVKDAFSILLTP